VSIKQQRLYDMVFLIVPEKDEQGVTAVVDEFRKLLVENNATIEKDETMGRRRLAFMIKKKHEATYHNFLFRGEPQGVAEVQRKMRLSEDILRFLTVRIDEELKHGEKVKRNTKVRQPRRIDSPMMDAPMPAHIPSAGAVSQPAAASTPAAPAPPAAPAAPAAPETPTE
jgi:small subunit ribosomal protein S6